MRQFESLSVECGSQVAVLLDVAIAAPPARSQQSQLAATSQQPAEVLCWEEHMHPNSCMSSANVHLKS